MKSLLIVFLIEVFCKPGQLYNIEGLYMEVGVPENKHRSDYYEMSIEEGAYMYVTLEQDTAYFVLYEEGGAIDAKSDSIFTITSLKIDTTNETQDE